MKECDILGGGQNIPDPSYIFSGVKTPKPPGSIPPIHSTLIGLITAIHCVCLIIQPSP